jgi:pyridoxamine 5'-phosphate oxidase
MADLSISRDEYDGIPLEADAIGDDPVAAIASWVSAADAAGEPQSNAMHLATADAAGKPSVRTVLLKGVDSGLLFFTNYTSAKAMDLAANPYAAANLTWLNIHRQIRAVGTVARLSGAESDDYFSSRPRGSQIAAAASDQSSPLPDRATLESAFAAISEQHAGSIPRPAHWGGYRLVPDRIEFWHGRRNRMHDRLEYTRADDGWKVQRLAP